MVESPRQPGRGRTWSWSRVAPFMALGGVLQMGQAMGISAADSLFIANVGADKLPVVYALTPIMMLAYIAGYTRLLARFGIDLVFHLTLGLLIVGGIAFGHLLGAGGEAPVMLLYAAKLYASLWYIALYSLVWNYVDGFFNLSDAKQVFGLIAGGAAFGAIIGGTVVNQLSEVLGVSALFYGWAGTALAAWPILRWIQTRVSRVAVAEEEEPDPRSGFAQMFGRLVQSRYVGVFTLVIFLTLVTSTLCEFRYMTIFEEHMRRAEDLAAMFGTLYAGVNVLNLLVTLLFFKEMVRRFGVRNVALVQPLVYIGAFGLLLLDGGVFAAVAGFVAYQGIMTSIDYNNINLLFNALPEAGKKETRTVIEGICEPLATATAGLFLLWAQGSLSGGSLSLAGFGVAVLCLLLVLVLRVDYVNAVATNVRQRWLDFADAAGGTLAWLRNEDSVRLRHRIEDTAAPDAERISAIGWARTLAPEETWENVLTVVGSLPGERAVAARAWLAEVLRDRAGDGTRHGRVTAWLSERESALPAALLIEFAARGLVSAAEGHRRLISSAPGDQATGVVVLWSGAPEERAMASRVLEGLLAAGDSATRVEGWTALGFLGDAAFIARLRVALRHNDPAQRRAALTSLGQLAGPGAAMMQRELLAWFARSHVEEERSLIIETFARINDSAVVLPLLRGLGSVAPTERRHLERLVIGFGPRAVPAVVNVLRDVRVSLAARSVAARALGKVALPQLEAMMPEMMDALVQRLYFLVGCRQSLAERKSTEPGLACLALVLADLPNLTLELAFELLSVAGRLPGYESIVAALRSDNGKERGFALESLEQACGRSLFHRLQPFLDMRDGELVPLPSDQPGKGLPPLTLEAVVERSLSSRFPFEAAAALQAAVEMAPARSAEICRDMLRRNPPALASDTARILLQRTTGKRVDEPTMVERVYLLTGHVFFQSWGMRSLDTVAAQLSELFHNPGEDVVRAGQPAEAVGVVWSGACEVEVKTGWELRAAPTVVGREALGAEGVYRRSVRAVERSRILWIPADVIRRCVRTQPHIGLELLQWKLEHAQE